METQKNLNSSVSPAVKNGQVLAEVWEDVVDVKELIYSLIISTIGSLGGYIIAPDTPPKPLLFGLAGAFISFLICAVVFKPKREFCEEEGEQ